MDKKMFPPGAARLTAPVYNQHFLIAYPSIFLPMKPCSYPYTGKTPDCRWSYVQGTGRCGHACGN
jgi:hypothetical protein